MAKYKICVSCSKKKSLPRFEDDDRICKRCNDSSPKDREVNMKDLLLTLEKINVSLVQLLQDKTR